ncbi:UPF0488 protein CG14286 [Musca vetustissima]|uniref:UPF0488 protein CG14286 n=1 Tax=Musca vetustissima TaxID=27455 RepID=UPI002AB705B8|nr:UPF0488 protein CG14286 [Musca vetustissima]
MNKMRKPKSMRPPMPIVTPSTSSNGTDVLGSAEADRQFELELCWCVQQLETALNTGKLSQKVAEDTVKNLKILKGRHPIIKKRQVMKASMGDYRSKMKEEEKKMSLAPKQIKFTSTAANDVKKSSFVKKSALLNSGKDFKFDFTVPETNGNADQEEKQTPTTDTSKNTDNFSIKKINLTSGNGFAFNFAIDEVNDGINFDGLNIKN